MATETKKSFHSPRRKKIPGGQPRKLYPYVTAEQRKGGIAPKMEKMIKSQHANLESAGNTPNALKSGRLGIGSKGVKGGLKRAWRNAINRGTRGKALASVMSSRGIPAKAAKSLLVGAHTVAFGADPKSK